MHPGMNPSALAWARACRAAASLGVAFAEFKLALDDYALITHGGDVDSHVQPGAAERRDYANLKARYDDLQRRVVRVAEMYGHDLETALGEHLPASNQESSRDG